MEKAGADPVEEEARVKEAAKVKAAAAKESMEAAVVAAMVVPWVAMEWEVEVAVCPRQALSSFSMMRKALVSSLNMMAALMSFATAGL